MVLLLWMWLIAFQRAAEFISLNVRLRSDALEAAGQPLTDDADLLKSSNVDTDMYIPAF